MAKQKTIAEIGQELWELLRAYALQETVNPLKKLGGYLAWGVGGMILVTLGIFFLGLGLLRTLQTKTGSTFGGSWSWVPYFVVALVLSATIAFAVRRILRAQQAEHRKIS